jgi:hypothetical protein
VAEVDGDANLLLVYTMLSREGTSLEDCLNIYSTCSWLGLPSLLLARTSLRSRIVSAKQSCWPPCVRKFAEVCHGEGLRVVVQHFETEDAVSPYAESPPNHEEDAWTIAYDYCTCLFITCGRAGKRM